MLKQVSLIAVVMTAFAFGIACGDDSGSGGGDLTLDEYFGALQALDQQAAADISKLTEPPLTEDIPLDERKASIEAYFTAFQEIGADFRDGIRDLDAPREVEELHEAYGGAVSGVVAAIDDALATIDGVTTDEGLGSAIDSVLVAGARSETVCTALQAAADANQIAADLGCGA